MRYRRAMRTALTLHVRTRVQYSVYRADFAIVLYDTRKGRFLNVKICRVDIQRQITGVKKHINKMDKQRKQNKHVSLLYHRKFRAPYLENGSELVGPKMLKKSSVRRRRHHMHSKFPLCDLQKSILACLWWTKKP
jgi:hypothetical protein